MTSNLLEFPKKIFFTYLVVCVFFWAAHVLAAEKFSIDKLLFKRPSQNNRHLYDYAGIFHDVSESTTHFLSDMYQRFAIETVIVSIPRLRSSSTIENFAAELFSRWEIGRQVGGRGILLLFSAREKLVKIEVAYELEDVFTDIFCGYIEDKQLAPYFLSGQINIGIVAVLEEIEKRARIKGQAQYSVSQIARLDAELLSGGAGARRDLNQYQALAVSSVGRNYPAGKSPDQAWQTLIQSWHDKVRDPNLGVYSAITRLAYRDFQHMPDSRYEEDFQTYHAKPYKVIQRGKVAVIFFGKQKGWANAPFLFCRTADGWQFDIVHQRKFVRMGRNPHWGIERSEYPYVELLAGCPFWMGQDIPRAGDDVYLFKNDRKLAEEILLAEQRYQKYPNDFQTVMRLGKLYTIVSLSPQKRLKMLKKAKKINPQHPDPYKYLGIVHVDAFYQYKSAIKEMVIYVKKRPSDVFGYNYLGYLYYQEKAYAAAIEALETAIGLKPDNGYAYSKLARVYAQQFSKAALMDPRRLYYKIRAEQSFHKAASSVSISPLRIKWLKQFLRKHKIELQS